VVAGLIGLASGWLLGALGINPVVKRIWTPSFTLWSGGWCFLITAGAYWLIDVRGVRRWAFPLVVIGMNSIAAYCLTELGSRFIGGNLATNFGAILRATGAYQPFVQGVGVCLTLWLIVYWMYKRRLFLRI
jgi:heparan-alpha-glucosaminide N-acetyltransferase